MEAPEDPTNKFPDEPEVPPASEGEEKRKMTILTRTAIANLRVLQGRAEDVTNSPKKDIENKKKEMPPFQKLFMTAMTSFNLLLELKEKHEGLYQILLRQLILAFEYIALTIIDEATAFMKSEKLWTSAKMLYVRDNIMRYEKELVPKLYQLDLKELAFQLTGAITQIKIYDQFGETKKDDTKDTA